MTPISRNSGNDSTVNAQMQRVSKTRWQLVRMQAFLLPP